jgi:hypothetical protein
MKKEISGPDNISSTFLGCLRPQNQLDLLNSTGFLPIWIVGKRVKTCSKCVKMCRNLLEISINLQKVHADFRKFAVGIPVARRWVYGRRYPRTNRFNGQRGKSDRNYV